MTLREIEVMEREHYTAIIGASESGGLSMYESCDLLARNSSRALTVAKSAVRENIELRAQVESLQQMAGARVRLHVALPANA